MGQGTTAGADVWGRVIHGAECRMLDLGATQSPVGSHAFYARGVPRSVLVAARLTRLGLSPTDRGVYTGYAAVVLPGVREATARKDWSVAAQQVGLVQAAIERGTLTLAEALQILGGGEAASANPPVRAAER